MEVLEGSGNPGQRPRVPASIYKLNSDIESGKVLNWKQFKKLKKHKTNVDKFDSYDMENFEKFFAKLYSNSHPTVSPEEKENFLHKATSINKQQTLNLSHSALNEQILVEEITTALKSFKNGKSSSDDMISNEILKSLSESNLKLLCKTFNQCLESGTYPWNNSIITPLHKKGCKSNPDNYRAVAVSSTIGKLFSTVILNRLIQYKNSEKPDPVNQLGFSKGAQTYDHILTLNTITSKYKKLKQPVYAVFVDFRKAFDSVCREALFLKLAKLGINGKVFDVLKHMYQNSTGQIKLSGFLSKKFDINKGTEQGHPLSPDLFKIYIRDLSPRLDHENCPKLLNQLVSHLLWADDLILLALDPETLQKQLDTLNKFCQEWGIEINVDKTKLMKFNSQFSNQLLRPTFKIGAHSVKEVESYCYLGIEIHQSGAFTLARGELKKKAMRALYALKNTVNKSKLSFRSTTTLFDSLIKPIVLYGAPIYTPTMSIIKTLKNVKLSDADTGSNALLLTHLHKNLLRKISLLNSEKVHLHFLKWAMGVNKKATNAGVWGDSGRYPLLYESINLTVKYANRLHNLKDSSLVSLAYEEQKKLNLDWYRGLEPILDLDPCFSDNHVAAFRRLTLTNNHSTHSRPNSSQQENTPKENFLVHKGLKKRIPPQSARPLRSKMFTPYIIIKTLKANYKKSWHTTINASRKLEFYRQLKSKFEKENYLDYIAKYSDRVNMTRLRISAHRLEIERGRYNQTPVEQRHCPWCKLVLNSEVTEDETHFLQHCDLNAVIRQRTLQKIISFTQNHETSQSLPSPSLHSTITITPSTNFLQLINNDSTFLSHTSSENQKHLHRIIAKFASVCTSNRGKFIKP